MPIVLGHVQRVALGPGDAGGVDEDVDRRPDLIAEPVDAVLGGKVRGVAGGVAAELLDFILQLVVLEVGEDDAGALGVEELRCGEADVAGPAGDEGGLVGEGRGPWGVQVGG